MNERGAVLRELGGSPRIEDIELAPISPEQIRVRVKASGICHDDVARAAGTVPARLPCVLGHEGAGVVEQVGAEVRHVQPGDHVVLTPNVACGRCWYCRQGEVHLCIRAEQERAALPYATDARGEQLFATLGLSTLATATNCLGRAAVKIDKRVPFEVASLVSCTIATGSGASMTTVPVQPGATVAVLGLGGVGMSVMLGAIVRGAACVVVVDSDTMRRDIALTLGATYTIDPAAGDARERVHSYTGRRGADFVFDTIGSTEAVELAIALTRRGGVVCAVGAVGDTGRPPIATGDLLAEGKSLVASIHGAATPERDFPMLLDLWATGRLGLDDFVPPSVALEDLPAAFDHAAAAPGRRAVVLNDPAG